MDDQEAARDSFEFPSVQADWLLEGQLQIYHQTLCRMVSHNLLFPQKMHIMRNMACANCTPQTSGLR